MKNKVLIGVLLVLILLLGGYIVYDKVSNKDEDKVSANDTTDNTKDNEEITLNSELDGLVSFVTKSTASTTSIVAITDNGQVVIYTYKSTDLSPILYDYSEGKLFLDINKNSLYSINLGNGNGNYELKKLYSDKEMNPIYSLAALNGDVYYSDNKAGFYQFDVSKDKLIKKDVTLFDETSGVNVYAYKDSEIFIILNQAGRIYDYNLYYGKTTYIKDGYVAYVNNSDIVYVSGSKDNYSYNIHNMNTAKTKVMLKSNGFASITGQTVPLKDAYYYNDYSIICKYANDLGEEIQGFDDYIDSMVLISKNELFIRVGEDVHTYFYTYNIDTKTVTPANDSTTYSSPIYID